MSVLASVSHEICTFIGWVGKGNDFVEPKFIWVFFSNSLKFKSQLRYILLFIWFRAIIKLLTSFIFLICEMENQVASRSWSRGKLYEILKVPSYFSSTFQGNVCKFPNLLPIIVIMNNNKFRSVPHLIIIFN